MDNMAMSSSTKMSNMAMSMSMSSINWQTHCVVFLFSPLHAMTKVQFFIGCLMVFILGMISQLVSCENEEKPYKDKMERKLLIKKNNSVDKNIETERPQIENQENFQPEQTQESDSQQINSYTSCYFKPAWKILETFTYSSLNTLLHFLLMLFAMTMNGYVILSVIFGISLGKTMDRVKKTIKKGNEIKKFSN